MKKYKLVFPKFMGIRTRWFKNKSRAVDSMFRLCRQKFMDDDSIHKFSLNRVQTDMLNVLIAQINNSDIKCRCAFLYTYPDWERA